MRSLIKLLFLTNLGIIALGAILICITQTFPAGIVALVVGSIGLLFSPLIALMLED